MLFSLHQLNSFTSVLKNIVVVSLAYGIYTFGGSLYWAAIPILGESVFTLKASSIGFLVSLIGVVYILSDRYFGKLVDSIGMKSGAFIACFLAIGTIVLNIVFPQSLVFFTIGIILYSFSWSLFNQAVGAYILFVSPVNKSGKMFGIFALATSLGVFISTFFIEYIENSGMFKVAIIFLITLVLSLIFLLFVKNKKGDRLQNPYFPKLREFFSLRAHREHFQVMKKLSPVSWVIAFDGFVGFMLNGVIWLAIPLSLESFENNYLPSGVALGIFEIGGVVGVFLGGILADRYSRKKVFLRLALLSTCGFFLLGIPSHFLIFVGVAFFTMVFRDGLSPVSDSLVASVDVNHKHDGLIYGTFTMFKDTGYIVGPIAAGFILDSFGLQGIFIFIGICLFISLVFSKIMLHKFEVRHITLIGRLKKYLLFR